MAQLPDYLILVIILAWNYLKLLLEAAERYVLLGVLIYTAPVAFPWAHPSLPPIYLSPGAGCLADRCFFGNERLVSAPFTSMVGTLSQTTVTVGRRFF